MTAIGSTLYFSAYDDVNGTELWKSNGTDIGTEMVKDINTSGNSVPRFLTTAGSTLYFAATEDGNDSNVKLWKSDGTETNTVVVKDINPNESFLTGSTALYSVSIGSTLYFGANNGQDGNELWKTDGTEIGTVLVRDIRLGSIGSYINKLTVMGSSLYFFAENGLYGHEFWKSDGTLEGTVLVKDINPGFGDCAAQNMFTIGSMLYFDADNGTNGRELWSSDGSAENTTMIADINPGSNESRDGSTNNNIVSNGSMIFFAADNNTNGMELWGLSLP